MIGKILIITAAIYGAIQLFFTTDKYARLILVTQIISIALTFINLPGLKSIGFTLFSICLFSAMVYTIFRTQSGKKKLLMYLIIVPVLISFVFRVMHWPGVYILSMMMILPITSFLVLLFSSIRSKNEIGFLAIIVGEAIIQLAHIVSSWIFAPDIN